MLLLLASTSNYLYFSPRIITTLFKKLFMPVPVTKMIESYILSLVNYFKQPRFVSAVVILNRNRKTPPAFTPFGLRR